jgi:HK97 family phage portal protein
MRSVMTAAEYLRNGISGTVPGRALTTAGPRASLSGDGGFLITSPEQLEEALRIGSVAANGQTVNAETAMRVGAVYGCVRLLSGPPATLPFQVKRRVDARTRVDASDSRIWQLLNRKPNRWQKPAEFKRMLTAHVLLRGNGYALKVGATMGGLQELIPLHPGRVKPIQNDDLTVDYRWTRKNGSPITVPGADILHLKVLTLDGVNGVTPITYARETIGLSLGMDRQVGTIAGNGARTSGVLKSPNKLSDPAYENLKKSIDEYRAGGDKEGEIMLLEEGLEYQQIGMSPEDMQWIEGKKLSRSEICMFFGVPPSMIGDNSGSDSNWGTGLEQKKNAFLAFTEEDYLTMWEEAINLDCLDSEDLYARYNRAALVESDIKARWDAYVKALQWGVFCPDDVLELEDRNPRSDGKGGIYYDPPNTAGKSGSNDDKEDDDEPTEPARK